MWFVSFASAARACYAVLSCVGCGCGQGHQGHYALHHRLLICNVSLSQASSCCPLVDFLGSKSGWCVDLVFLEFLLCSEVFGYGCDTTYVLCVSVLS